MNAHGKQIIAARALLGWSQQELADRAGIGVSTVQSFEKGDRDTRTENKEAIIDTLEKAGIDFSSGGVRPKSSSITIREGPDCYLKILDDVYYTLHGTGGEVLFSSSDERKSSAMVNKKLDHLRNAGIHQRSLIEEGNPFIYGNPEEYRCIPSRFFTINDVTVIYADKVVFVHSPNPVLKVTVLQDHYIAEDYKRLFEFMWEHGAKVGV